MTVASGTSRPAQRRVPPPRRWARLGFRFWSVVAVMLAVVVATGVFVLRHMRTSLIPAAAPGWHLTMADDFQSSGLNPSNWWGAYSGQPGGDTNGWWSPSHVQVGKGMLVLRAYKAATPEGIRYVSGGIGQVERRAQVYGRYLVRMRTTSGKGISTVALLFPTGTWPPEIDFYEDGPTTSRRDSTAATLHYGPGNHMIQRELKGIDLTKWHTFGLDWLPGRLVYTVDGRTWATVTGSEVPAVPMTLDLQSQALACAGTPSPCPDATTPPEVDTEVAWVAVYQRNGR